MDPQPNDRPVTARVWRRSFPAIVSPEVIERAFKGDEWVLRRFVATLREPLGDSRIVLRGSAVTGESYRGRERFDARGPGTSDLDLVVLGEDAMRLWLPNAFYFPGVNTKPLGDKSRWVAPTLDLARQAAQALVERPVNIQAMAAWFLELRALLQVQRHVFLTEDR
jgi:hypothetical protein